MINFGNRFINVLITLLLLFLESEFRSASIIVSPFLSRLFGERFVLVIVLSSIQIAVVKKSYLGLTHLIVSVQVGHIVTYVEVCITAYF